MRVTEVLKLSLPAAIVGSLCCLSPLVFVLLGASASSFGVVLFTRTLGPYEWAFFLGGAVLFGGSLIAYFRSRNICTLDQVRARRREVLNTALLVAVAALVIFGLVYGGVAVAGQSLGLW
jgi:NAD/NADP transhydrogenase beta subunit